MRHALSFLAPLAGILAAQACTTSIQVGTDGSGGQATGSSSSSSSSSGSTTGSTSSSSTGSTTVDAGTPDPTCWDNNPVSGLGGPCGGFMANPASCIAGLTCHTDFPDAVGTCIAPTTAITTAGGTCGGEDVPNPIICPWNCDCVPGSNPSPSGTCVYRNCASPPGNGCTNPEITVAGDGPTRTFDALCQGSSAGNPATSAIGYIGYPGPHWTGPEEVWIKGCSTAGGMPLQGSLSLNAPQAVVGTTMLGTLEYDSGTDQYTNGGTATISVTALTADTISGTYTASVQPSNGNGVTKVWGHFRVCRTADFLPP